MSTTNIIQRLALFINFKKGRIETPQAIVFLKLLIVQVQLDSIVINN